VRTKGVGVPIQFGVFRRTHITKSGKTRWVVTPDNGGDELYLDSNRDLIRVCADDVKRHQEDIAKRQKEEESNRKKQKARLDAEQQKEKEYWKAIHKKEKLEQEQVEQIAQWQSLVHGKTDTTDLLTDEVMQQITVKRTEWADAKIALLPLPAQIVMKLIDSKKCKKTYFSSEELRLEQAERKRTAKKLKEAKSKEQTAYVKALEAALVGGDADADLNNATFNNDKLREIKINRDNWKNHGIQLQDLPTPVVEKLINENICEEGDFKPTEIQNHKDAISRRAAKIKEQQQQVIFTKLLIVIQK